MKLSTQRNKKIGIAVPCRDQVHSLFTYSLVQLIQETQREKIQTELYMLGGSLIADQRHKLAKMCIADRCTHILWLDSDMIFPKWICSRLVAHSVPIIACNYSTRTEPRKSVAYKTMGVWEKWHNSAMEKDQITKVAAIGMGCMLTETSVFEKMDDPYFEITYDKKLKEWIGEDFYFCKKAQKVGFNVLVDNKLSMEVYHLGTTAFDNQTLV